ncbi:hypothetical protein EYF80_016144 [Liparis tanakae]|uniref:Uncharacterized protein n=1 Tax=Liparis tanakae TaxID=230148 RepID=A0A4Z2I670_9TELE|nr:hypothetical protein EYF80_016144 [Liparis tanakae]
MSGLDAALDGTNVLRRERSPQRVPPPDGESELHTNRGESVRVRPGPKTGTETGTETGRETPSVPVETSTVDRIYV